MSKQPLRTVPHGVMHVPVTPFKDDMSVDYATFEKLVDWHVRQKPSSLCVILHIAESVSLTVEEHKKLIEVSVKVTNGRVPVIANVSNAGTEIAIDLARHAEKVGADAVCHGATGKGNDQVRFELTYYALKPDIKVIAPWREWELTSRTKLLEFAEQHQIPIAKDKRGEAPFSVDANLLHSSSEGKVLEDPALEADSIVYQRTIAPEDAPDKATYVEIGFEKGDAVSIDGKRLSPAALLAQLNALGKANGIGRIDLVENRFVGMKSRGVYETPGGTILLVAHRSIESITLDREAAHLKDSLMPKYAELVYNGFWFSPERRMIQSLADESQKSVTGTVRLKLYKGNARVVGRQSPYSLYDQEPAHI